MQVLLLFPFALIGVTTSALVGKAFLGNYVVFRARAV